MTDREAGNVERPLGQAPQIYRPYLHCCGSVQADPNQVTMTPDAAHLMCRIRALTKGRWIDPHVAGNVPVGAVAICVAPRRPRPHIVPLRKACPSVSNVTRSIGQPEPVLMSASPASFSRIGESILQGLHQLYASITSSDVL